MGFSRKYLATLALLVACSGSALARPGAVATMQAGVEAEAEAGTAAETLPSCPHTMHRLATPQDFTGDWYFFEKLSLLNNITQLMTIPVPCVHMSYALHGDRLSLARRVVDAGISEESNFTFAQAPNGRWERTETDGGFFLGMSSDSSLLIMCGSNSVEEVTSIVMGRSPHVDEAALVALRTERFRDAVAIQANIPDCTSTHAHDADMQDQ